MAPMKAMNAKSMTKGGIAEALSTSTETKKSVCGQILNSLAEIATNTRSEEHWSVHHSSECSSFRAKCKTRVKPAAKALEEGTCVLSGWLSGYERLSGGLSGGK